MAIGMRYHSLIMAAAQGCKCWAIGYDPKVSKLMTEIKIPGWELTNIPANPSEIAYSWQQHLTTGAALSPQSISALSQNSLAHRELLFQALEG